MPNVTSLRPDDPRRVGRYRLTGRVDELVTGGPGPSAVFLAQRVDGETVMVTLLAAGRAGDAAARDRFAAEARVARRVPPFCVAKILDSGLEGDRPYLITESVTGATLAQIVAQEGPLPAETLRALAIGCATGLASIHDTGLVHGQFGPELVVLSRDGPRVLHFTITPPYGTATPAADMRAWARTILFAAAGRHAGTPQDVMGLPDELRSVVADCLSPDPAARPLASAALTELLSGGGNSTARGQSGQDLSAGLLAEGARQARSAARTAVSTAAPPGRQAPRRAQSKTVLWIAGCAACLLAIAAAVVYIIGLPSASAPAGKHQATPRGHLAGPQPTVPARFAGSWSGTVHQTDPVLAVTVQLTLPPGEAHGTIGYPKLHCAGRTVLLSEGPGLVTLKITITSGQSTCVSGKVRLAARKDGSLAFTFLQPGGNNPTGKLAKAS